MGKNASGKLQPLIELAVLTLMATGTVFVFSAGANIRSEFTLLRFYEYTTVKQILFFPLAVCVMYLVACIDYRRFSFTRAGPANSLTPYLLALAIILLTLVLIPGIGTGIGPEKTFARRWLNIPLGTMAVSFQPSELAKWSLLFFLAAFLDEIAEGIRNFWKGFVPPCLVAGLVVGLIITQDFGTAVLIATLAFLMLVIGCAKCRHFLTPILIVLPAFVIAVLLSPTRMNRFKAFFNPDSNNSAAYQAKQSLIAISSGGIWGKGLGRGISKYGHLPEDTTDFIFSIIAEELGFIGAVFVILLFVALIILSIIVILRCRDRFGRLLAGGIILAIAIQAAINIGVVSVVLPTKGIPLPFISAGGSSMLLFAAAAGVLLNITKQTHEDFLERATFIGDAKITEENESNVGSETMDTASNPVTTDDTQGTDDIKKTSGLFDDVDYNADREGESLGWLNEDMEDEATP